MGRIEFNIDTNETIVFVNKLERLHRAAFPNAIRGTINSMAFDVKKNTMPKSAKRFNNREKNFFKANSSVEVARGFNTNNMESRVGFFPASRVENKKSVDDLEVQEHGGVIRGRKYVPLNNARVSKSGSKRIAKRNRLGEIGIKNIVRSKDMPGKSQGHRFLQAVHEAGRGGFVQAKLKGRSVTMVWRVNSLARTRGGRFKLTAVYVVNDSKKVKVKRATHFMKKATEKSASKGVDFFHKEAERQIAKFI